MPNHQSPFQKPQYAVNGAQPDTDPLVAARKQAVIALLKTIQDPILQKDIVSLGMVRNLRLVDNYIYLRLYVGAQQQHLQETVQRTLATIDWCQKVYVQICTIPGVKRTIAVSSGKGGVGKSTTAVNLAAALTLAGAKVGILDADIYGPNIPQMLGLGQAPVTVIDTPDGQRYVPLEAHGIKLMSVGLLTAHDHPLAWRGPVLHKLLTQFLHDVDWGELDYLLVDLPPGTGDAQITIVQESPICSALVVTTPQQVAVSDVRRSIHMFRQVGVPILGLIENMSYILCGHCGEPTPIFGSGGGKLLEQDLQIPLLGQVPIDPRICQMSDLGRPLPLTDQQAPISRVFKQVALGLQATFNPQCVPVEFSA